MIPDHLLCVCGHSCAAHQGHTYTAPPEPTHCSRACGCKKFRARANQPDDQTPRLGIVEALLLCQDRGKRVRPVCWRTLNAVCWVEALPTPHHDEPCIFIEKGLTQEMPHALRLQFPPEFLGKWEVVA